MKWIGWALEMVDRPFCRYWTCLFVEYSWMKSLLWRFSEPVEDSK